MDRSGDGDTSQASKTKKLDCVAPRVGEVVLPFRKPKPRLTKGMAEHKKINGLDSDRIVDLDLMIG
jgi:hypothetical protein